MGADVMIPAETLFLKLGGSLITDKSGVEAVRHDVLARLAKEIGDALEQKPSLGLLVGHGSGSFGHVAAAKYGTRLGVHTPAEWRGFTEVSSAAARLNRLVVDALLAAGIPAISLQPSASAVCEDGVIISLALAPVRAALEAGLVPVVYGDVAFDTVRGGTIISTEEVLSAMVGLLRPSWLLLAGETDGVYDLSQKVIPVINTANFGQLRAALGDSRGTDVTGGMVSKVEGMVSLGREYPALSVRVFSGLEQGCLHSLLLRPDEPVGTIIRG